MQTNQTLNRDPNKPIAIWLLSVCTVIFAMVVLGGVTRLTGSGLSMVEWKPLLGILPPLSQEQWEATFQLYQQHPEFQFKNNHLDVEGFKNIFWLEYFHRLLGRTIGIIFFIPMLYFIIKGYASKALKPKLVIMFILGGLQGLMGWYMVKSGLINDAHVSQYRLTAHLGFAFIIYGYIFWTALGLIFPRDNVTLAPDVQKLRRFALGISTFAFVTVLSGGFVAGLRAGFIYNTFPLMDGRLIPADLFALEPLLRNFFENFVTVQFDHRVLAITLFLLVSVFWWLAQKVDLPRRARIATHLLLAAMFLQITLGITTLLLIVPIPLAAAHQGGAVILFTAALYTAHALRSSAKAHRNETTALAND